MKKIPIIVFTIALIFCSLSGLHAQDKVHLKYDFKTGAKLNYKMTIDGDVTIDIKPASGKIVPRNSAKIEGNFNYTHEVSSTDDKTQTADINVIYGESKMHTIVNDQVIPNTDVPLLNGKVAVVNVGYNGEVKDYKLPEGLPESLQNADFKKMFTVFPNRDLRIGESWMENSETVSEENPNYIVKNTVHSTRTLLGIEKKGKFECAKIQIVSNTSTVTTSKNPQVRIDGKVEGRVEGIVYYDLNRGYIVHSALNTKINNRVTTGESNLGVRDKSSEVITILNTDLNTVVELL